MLDISNNGAYIWTDTYNPFPQTPTPTPTPTSTNTTKTIPSSLPPQTVSSSSTTIATTPVSSSPPGAMVGAVIGSLFGGALLSFGGFFLYKRYKKRQDPYDSGVYNYDTPNIRDNYQNTYNPGSYDYNNNYGPSNIRTDHQNVNQGREMLSAHEPVTIPTEVHNQGR